MQNFIRIIVSSLEQFALIGIIFVMLGGLVIGYGAAGFFGMIAGLLVAFIGGVLTFGILFMLIENNRNLREICQLLSKK